jgi:prepilin-type N-terminal cleavage/methylation domain-containing protein
MVNISFKKRGFSLIEIIIASSIFLLAVTTIFSSYAIALKATVKNTAYLQAAFLAEEGNEALKNMRDFGWSNYVGSLSVGTPYRLSWTAGMWQATTTNTFIDGKFDRAFVLSAVSRDGSNNIVSSGGTVDTNTKKVVVSVSWNEGGATTTKTMESYVSNIFSN